MSPPVEPPRAALGGCCEESARFDLGDGHLRRPPDRHLVLHRQSARAGGGI